MIITGTNTLSLDFGSFSMVRRSGRIFRLLSSPLNILSEKEGRFELLSMYRYGNLNVTKTKSKWQLSAAVYLPLLIPYYVLMFSANGCWSSLEVSAANPNEKNILYKILKLLKLNIELIFVADGSNRPKEKYGGQSPWYKYLSQDDTLLKQAVTSLGVIWHEAPGEAEAECAVMQSRGVVDAVWTEDSDAFMFGCTTLIRFCYVKKSKKNETEKNETEKNQDRANEPVGTTRKIDIDNIVVYRADKIQEMFPGLNRDGLVLFAVLKGGDYSKNGKSLTNCRAVLAHEIATAKEGFGKDLCNASVTDFPAWSNRLRKYLIKKNSQVNVPDDFPDPRIVRLYNRPLVSSERVTNDIGKFWNPSFDEIALQRFIAPKFNFWVTEYIKHIIPILLVRSLASTEPGQEASNNCYKLKVITKKKKPVLQQNVEVLLSAVTLMDIPAWRKEFTKVGRDGKIAPATEMVRCEGLLSCIIEHGTKKALPPDTQSFKHDNIMASLETMSKGKRRAESPVAPSNTFSSPQIQPPSKRTKSTSGQSSTSRPVAKAFMELPQAPNTSSSAKKTPLHNLPEEGMNQSRREQHREAQPSKAPKHEDTKKSSGLTIDLTLDDSDE